MNKRTFYLKMLVFTVVIIIAGTALNAQEVKKTRVSFDWVGGGAYVENNSKPGYMIDAMFTYGEYPKTEIFVNPYGSVRSMEPGCGLGVGVRFPVHSERHALGFNTYLDYTDDHSGLRIGFGAEYFGPYFSNVLNVYLPISGRHTNEEAIPGFDFYFKVPVPKFTVPIGSYKLKVSFISVWPGMSYYKSSGEDLIGVKLLFMGQPVRSIEFWRGFTNGSVSNDQYKGIEIPAGLTIQLPVKNFKLKEQFGYLILPYPAVAKDSIKDRPFREHFLGVEKYQDDQ